VTHVLDGYSQKVNDHTVRYIRAGLAEPILRSLGQNENE
jgi:hypothetical protein